MLEEAEKRDHRRLAQELDLCSWPQELGPGLVVWHPKGATVRRLMEDYSRARHATGGYEFVYSPHIARSLLWEISGHLDFYADGMYPPMELDEGVKYYPKPMNCPFHFLIFRSRQRSYRELPLRLFELGAVYRYELSGVVHGLLRARGFTQDDSHIFCTREQLVDEIEFLLDFVLDILRKFGFEDFEANLSTRPFEKSVGDDDEWEEATEALRTALVRENLAYQIDEGGGAFYGPKIDVKVARRHRPALAAVHHPVRLQRAPALRAGVRGRRWPAPPPGGHPPGAVRLGRALLRHPRRALRRRLPDRGWRPVQVRVLGVRADHQVHVDALVERLRAAGFRADTVDGRRAARRPHPAGQAGEAALRARRRRRRHRRRRDVRCDRTVGVNPRGGDVERGVPVGDVPRPPRRRGGALPGHRRRRRGPADGTRAAVGGMAVGLRHR